MDLPYCILFVEVDIGDVFHDFVCFELEPPFTLYMRSCDLHEMITMEHRAAFDSLLMCAQS